MLGFFIKIGIVNIILDIITEIRCRKVLRKHNLIKKQVPFKVDIELLILYFIPIINLIPLVLLTTMAFGPEVYILHLREWCYEQLKQRK